MARQVTRRPTLDCTLFRKANLALFLFVFLFRLYKGEDSLVLAHQHHYPLFLLLLKHLALPTRGHIRLPSGRSSTFSLLHTHIDSNKMTGQPIGMHMLQHD